MKEVKKILITGRVRSGKTTLIRHILDKYRNRGLNICFYNQKYNEVNLEGYESKQRFSDESVTYSNDIVVLESEQVIDDLDLREFKPFTIMGAYNVTSLFIVSCISKETLDWISEAEANKMFDIFIDLNKISFSDAKEKIDGGVTECFI